MGVFHIKKKDSHIYFMFQSLFAFFPLRHFYTFIYFFHFFLLFSLYFQPVNLSLSLSLSLSLVLIVTLSHA